MFEQRRHVERNRDIVEDPHDDRVDAASFGDGERFVGEGLAAIERAAVGELCAQDREHERPVGVISGETLECHLQDLDLVGVDGTNRREESAVVGQGGSHEPFGVAEVGRPPGRADKRVPKHWIAGLALRGAEPDRQVEPEGWIVVVLGVELEGLGVVAQRIGGSEGTEGRVAGLAGVVDGLGQVDGLGGAEPVPGQLTDACAGTITAEGFEGLADLSMCTRSTVGPEVFVEGALNERVGEVVTARVGHLAHQGHRDRRVEHVEKVIFRGLRCPGQNIEVEVAADHGCDREDALGLLSEAPDPRTDHFADAVGQRGSVEGVVRDPTPVRVLGDRTGLGQMPQHFADEERIAVGLAIHRVGQPDRRVVEGVTGGRLHERDHVGVVEPGQLDAANTLLAAQGRQRLQERMRARQLAIPIGPEHEEPHRLIRRHDVTQQLQARLVRPLQVIEHQHDRLVS